MYLLSLFYVRWINFWRLPETRETRRTESADYVRRVDFLRTLWILCLPMLAITGQPAFFITGIMLLVFVSFMFLDET